ncbi:hypothetical protein [Streptomyces cinereoruber]|uniref:hypothetical protein n=1 Tax=Streptomyces cinereoruber TaxID=67260 RepID=UPI0036452486
MYGYGQGEAMRIHRTRENGETLCGAEAVTEGDRDSADDLVWNHGYQRCVSCSISAMD